MGPYYVHLKTILLRASGNGPYLSDNFTTDTPLSFNFLLFSVPNFIFIAFSGAGKITGYTTKSQLSQLTGAHPASYPTGTSGSFPGGT
jgi:hypothetical protein